MFQAEIVTTVFHEKLNKALDMILGRNQQKPIFGKVSSSRVFCFDCALMQEKYTQAFR